MRTTDYLYDCLASEFMKLNYVEALLRKIELADLLMDKLRVETRKHLNVNLEIYETLMKRYQDVEKAKIFNQNLLEELRSEVADNIIMI